MLIDAMLPDSADMALRIYPSGLWIFDAVVLYSLTHRRLDGLNRRFWRGVRVDQPVWNTVYGVYGLAFLAGSVANLVVVVAFPLEVWADVKLFAIGPLMAVVPLVLGTRSVLRVRVRASGLQVD
jgi:intracellular septation protein A